MAETFEPEFKPYLKTLLVMCNRACWHWFIILTKQPQNIPKDLVFPSNVIVGVSVNCKNDLWRIAELKKVQCVIRMVSFEPLYEDLAPIVDLSGIQWIVIGAQKRPSIQPKTEWVKNLEYAAESRFIPVFLKDNLSEFTWMKCRNCPPKVYQTKYFHQPAVEPEVRFPASKEVALFE
jgi:protein gp37